jgi:hypothetical protein
LVKAEETIAQRLNVFLLFAFPVEALKFPNVPIIESSIFKTTGGFKIIGNQEAGFFPRTNGFNRLNNGFHLRLHNLFQVFSF